MLSCLKAKYLILGIEEKAIKPDFCKGGRYMKTITEFFKFTIGFIVYVVKRNT